MRKQLNCVIVDDEPLAQNLIEKFINRLPHLALLAKYDNAVEAAENIAILQPELVFLDINMPEMSGIEFLQSFSNSGLNFIMTTAYPEHALEGFEYNAIDYLLKPIAFPRFSKAVNKVVEKLNFAPAQDFVNLPRESAQLQNALQTIENAPPLNERFFMVKEDKKLIKVNIDEIVFVEGMKDYVKIHLFNRFIVTHITMTKVADLLTSPQFIRINRSFIVQVAFIKLIEGNMIETTNGCKLSIGINYRGPVKEAVQKWVI